VRRTLTHTAVLVALAALGAGLFATPALAGEQMAYVTNEQAGTLVPVNLATGAVGTAIAVGSEPVAVAITPNGQTAYVADHGSSEVVPVDLATGAVGSPIALAGRPNAIAISPNGATAYVASDAGHLWPIALSSQSVGAQIQIPTNSDAIAISADGSTAYITNVADATVTPLSLSTGRLGQPIDLPAPTPDGIAITTGGAIAYVTGDSGGTLTPVNLTTGSAASAISVGSQPTGVAISADATTAYVTNFSAGTITPVTLATGVSATPLAVGGELSAIALAPQSGTASGSASSGGTSSAGSGTTLLSGASLGQAETSTSAPVSLGDQQLTLSLSGWVRGLGNSGRRTSATGPSGAGGSTRAGARAGARRRALACHSPRSIIRVRLTRRLLHRGARLKLRLVTFRLGRRLERAKRLPATARLPLLGLRRGRHPLIVRALFTEHFMVRTRRRLRRSLAVTVSRRLVERINVC
jgi:DNA-binding beta-propeller fold protein YncE